MGQYERWYGEDGVFPISLQVIVVLAVRDVIRNSVLWLGF